MNKQKRYMREVSCRECKEVMFRYTRNGKDDIAKEALLRGKAWCIERDGVRIIYSVCSKCKAVSILDAFESGKDRKVKILQLIRVKYYSEG